MIVPYSACMAPTFLLNTAGRSQGRPREFVLEEVLDKALTLFSERGYHATSVDDLKSAIGLTTGSIYKAFGDKRTLFLAALDRYVATRQERLLQQISHGKSGYQKLEIMLRFYVGSAIGADGARGCMVVGTATDLSSLDQEFADKVTAAFTRNESMLKQMLLLGKQDGSLRADIEVDAAAYFLLCLLQGMRVVGKVGASREKMMAVVDQALASFV